MPGTPERIEAVDADLTRPAALIAEPTRAAMLDALMSGKYLAAGELARIAGVSRPTASEHLHRLLDGGMVEVISAGRHRYYRLAGPHVASALESLAHIGPPKPVTTLRQSQDARALSYARTCYDHLAGVCGVALLDTMLERSWLTTGEGGYAVTPAGESELVALGIDVTAARAARRSFARPCPDWTERRTHLAGALAAAVTTRLIDIGWFARRPSHSRALRLTDDGRQQLTLLGCRLD